MMDRVVFAEKCLKEDFKARKPCFSQEQNFTLGKKNGRFI